MSPIHYTTGDATAPIGSGPKVIVHICNDIGGWGKGFVLAISKRWKQPEAEYRRWHKEGGEQPFALGEVQFVEVDAGLWVANLVGQHRIAKHNGQPPIRYDAVEQGLAQVAHFAKTQNASVHMPRIGCGLAGGKWDEIEPIIERTLASVGIAVTVYDFA